MKKVTRDQLPVIDNINRRDFLKFSGNAAGIVGGALLTNLSIAAPLNQTVIDSGKVANVWVNDQGSDNWNKYYEKLVSLLNQKDSALDTQWIKQDQQYLLKITMDEQLSYPHSTDPKLVYSMVRYLVNEKSIPAKNIIITDQVLSKKSAGLTAQLALLRTSGIYSGLRRALPLNKMRSLKSQNKMPLKWLGHDSDFDHVIELTSLTCSHNMQRIDAINNQSSKEIISLQDKPRIIISSATKICNDIDVITLQPGMILASNNLISHELLANAYFNFNLTQTAMTSENGYQVVHKNRSDRVTKISEATFKAMKQQGHLSEINWYSDNKDAPAGVVDKISFKHFPGIRVNKYSVA